MALWVPPSEQARQLDDRRRYIASVVEQRQFHAQIKGWNEKLQAIDPKLELVKAPDNAKHPALRPGFWHVLRHAGSEVPPAIMVHEGPDGEYREPDSGMLEALRKGDMWSERSQKAMRERGKKAARAAELEEQREKEERVDRVMDMYRHKYVTKVAI